MKNIYKAKDSLTSKVYTISDLRKLSVEDGILRRLICVNCGCPMTFTHDSAARGAFLKTWNGQKHDQDCSNYFEREERKLLYETGQVQDGRLDAKALKTRLKRMDNLLKQTDEKGTINIKPRSHKKTKNPTSGMTTKNTQRNTVTRINPTTNPAISVVEKESHTHVRMDYRIVGTIEPKQIGRTIVIGGTLNKVTIGTTLDPRASLYVNYNGNKLVIRLRPDIFQRQIGLLDRIQSLRNILAKVGQQPNLSAIVEIQVSASGNIEAILLDENALHIDDQMLGVYITSALH